MPQLLFGGVLACVLLVFYIWAIVDSVVATRAGLSDYSPNMSYLLNTIGGLISAVVVGVLGATQPGDFPAEKTLTKTIKGTTQSFVRFIPSVFILVWIACGVAMVVFGFILYENSVPALNAQAKVWLGAAIGAVYAYMGIRPNGNSVAPNPANGNNL